MNHLFVLSIFSLSSVAFAAQDWKVIAETTTCAEKIQILGKEGEKYVLANLGENKIKLFSKDGSVFHENSMSRTEFASDKSTDVAYNFIQPSYVEGNPPKIDVLHEGSKRRCKMKLSR